MFDAVKEINFSDTGLVPAVIQDHDTGEVLMLVSLNRQAVEKSLETGRVHYLSPGRRKVWMKGETSGHYQNIMSIRIDCDGDALLFSVKPSGGACHRGFHSCFHRLLEDDSWVTDANPSFDPESVYPEYTYK